MLLLFTRYMKKSNKIAEIWFVFKIWLPPVSVIFTISRKKLGIKKILFAVDKKLVFTSWNEESAEKYVAVEEKTASTGSSWLQSEKMKENGFH